VVRVRVEASLVQHRVDHRELAERDAVAPFQLGAIAGHGHDPLVVGRKEDRAFETLRDLKEVLHEPAFVLEGVRAGVPLGHGS
jgi:hypothetical protein